MTDAFSPARLGEELHVWVAYPDRIAATCLAEKHLSVLSTEEQERFVRFHFEKDRHHYLAAHALLRHVLSRYQAMAPRTWRFLPGPNGKPEIDPAQNRSALQFNLTHTRGLVACAVAIGRDCGIDVECMRPMKDLDGLAATVLSEKELAWFDARPADNQLAVFFSFWTIKEAYIKATGLGLSAPLRQISFAIDGTEISVEDATVTSAACGNWLFDRQSLTANHPLAVAVRPSAGLQAIVYHEFDFQTGASRVMHRQPTPTRPAGNPAGPPE